MKHELKIFFTAIMFYTRIPVPKSTGFSPENLNKATRYFPLIGIIVGSAGALSFWTIYQLFPLHIAILAGLISMILLTGAFHEDAFSDFCDGFGGGYEKKQILAIMKDSRVGTYGAIGLILLILTKFILLCEFKPSQIPLILIAAHAMSRVNPVIMIFSSQYIRDDNSAKSKPVGQKNSINTLILAIIFGLLPLVFISPLIIPFLIFAYALIFIYFRHYVHKKVGGYTGDILGALQQFSEVGFYLTYLIV
ncbi:MAG: adenosylcobinamide-GDP ribazoletransferase, partial [Bacteroidetes bacterium]|nr:adenosylcobinamide-GDP ribazoletransferase [Bacteroidota bacterium]